LFEDLVLLSLARELLEFVELLLLELRSFIVLKAPFVRAFSARQPKFAPLRAALFKFLGGTALHEPCLF